MRNPSDDEKPILLIRGLFKGREDVFAIRWEKGKKSGYMPAYYYDPYLYKLHRMKGGNFGNYKDKSYKKLTDQEVLKHLNGDQCIGIYPLLHDNTSWFIASDFDKKNWEAECRKFIETSKKYGINAYLERSRSGKGGHVWVFFNGAYPAIKSRKIFTHLLIEANLISIFDKSGSFDRLFPNQDYHSGKGLGNLIALPFYKRTLSIGNTCFIDPETLIPFPDQWKFLAQIQPTKISSLEQLYGNLFPKETRGIENLNLTEPKKLQISLDSKITLNRTGIKDQLIQFLRSNLNFANTEFFIKQKSGKSTWGINKYHKAVEELDGIVLLPRGFIRSLIRYCKQNKLDFTFDDRRFKKKYIPYSSNIVPLKHQEIALEAAEKKDFGIIVAPPGSGKTVMALKIIAQKQQPALIIVHRKQLANQWMESIESFLGIPKRKIGKIGQGKHKIGEEITVAMIQTLNKLIDQNQNNDLLNNFGILIVDECHHIPANTYRNTIDKINTYYLYGLTATPFRKNKDERLIFAYLGDIICKINPENLETYKRPRLIVRRTSLDIPFNSKTDSFETLSKVLIHDSTRNQMILQDVKNELTKENKVIIITERKDHISLLHQLLKQTHEVITLSGDDSVSTRESKWKLIKTGNFQILITTGQYFGEGSDIKNVSRLFLVFPFSFKGKLIQYIGRVQRSEFTPVIYDYRDYKIPYLDKLFLKRNIHYRHLDRQATLFDDNSSDGRKKLSFRFNKTIKIPIEALDFRFGCIGFNSKIPGQDVELEFEIEHDEIRPEFDILKPYFAKVLGIKNVKIEVDVEFENGGLVAQIASSNDLEKVNQQIIESVKFRLLENKILKSRQNENQNSLLKLSQLTSGKEESKLFESESNFIENILGNKRSKHYLQLRYLSEKHDYHTLKVRFVLKPFSFVFLITGQREYHLVLETLETEEATYIWHIEKDLKILKNKLIQIDDDLSRIRNEGRKKFLQDSPDQFSKIIHDYSDERKGFIKWKHAIEERFI